MRHAWIVGCALLLGACETQDEVICLYLSPTGESGGGGAGGTSSATTSNTGSGGALCDPELRASVGCFEPDAACCDYDAPSLKCHVSTEGVYPTPFFCADTTKALAASCVTVENGDTACAWGKSQLVCCNGV